MRMTRSMASLAAMGVALCLGTTALADVKAGVEAWERGDYAAAVSQWDDLAKAGDADAQFNMAQAYRLGRGVDKDTALAEDYYAKASAQGHLQAGDNYGLLLFQGGQRDKALPFIEAAAGRGDPRAQYLLGISHFNGDLVAKDWVKAYALLTLANSTGLPQAKNGIAQMDKFIPLEQRQQAQGVAQEMKLAAEAAKISQLAAADLGAAVPAPARPAPAITAAPMPAPTPARTLPATASVRVPDPVPAVRITPSVAAAQAAVEEAVRVLGTDNPAQAGADFAGGTPTQPAAAVSSAPVLAARAKPPAPAAASPASRAATGGPWKVQLGAFSVAGNADRLWSRLSGKSALAGSDKVLAKSGRITRLQAGGFASRKAAQQACSMLKRSGQACLVTK